MSIPGTGNSLRPETPKELLPRTARAYQTSWWCLLLKTQYELYPRMGLMHDDQPHQL